MSAETISHPALKESLVRSISRTVIRNRPSRKWPEQVYLVREQLLEAGETDNSYVHAVLAPLHISTASEDIIGDITGCNHRKLMTRFGTIRKSIKQSSEPLRESVQKTADLINIHTPDASNSDRYAVFGHLLGQAGVEVTALPPDTNPADRFDCKGRAALIISEETIFVGLLRNAPRIETQGWQTPYVNLPRLR
ncbi:hypothetical protein EYC59_06110 [Candidatus Saccharibacteria bacterium]|nr:MAG: hypothetical protein EYC59_06110 [Candidatus Saccharibacteria bacterium]